MSNNKEEISMIEAIKSFDFNFWLANIQELFERWAWYGIFGVLGIYLTGSTDVGGLGLTHIEKGEIMSYSTFILYLLPVVFGAISDRIGYKISLIIAYAILIVGYYFMGEATTYWTVFSAYLFIAFGAALFKPIPSALVAIHSTPKTVNMGFGVMYALVNIGGFVGPAMSSYLRTTYGWKLIFIQASIVIGINLLLVIFFYKEKKREKDEKPILESVKDTLNGIVSAVSDKNLAVLLVIMIGFWTMFNQLFYTLPSFLEDWVDRKQFFSQISDISPGLAYFMSDKHGAITPEWFVNLDALAIIIFQIFVSYFVAKMNYISAMVRGLIISIIGLSITFYTDNALYSVLGIFIFAIGEMATSPTFSSVIAAISPKGKNALYQATYFLPVAAGNYFTKFIAGDLYQAWSDKLSLLKDYVANKNIVVQEIGTILNKEQFIEKVKLINKLDVNEALKLIPKGDVTNWTPIIDKIRILAKSNKIENFSLSGTFSKNDYFAMASEKLHMTEVEMTKMIWDTYNPNKIWYVIAAIGVVTVIALAIYNFKVVKPKERKLKEDSNIEL